MSGAVDISKRIEAGDTGLFDHVEAQTSEWDRRALLALHSAAASTYGSFCYLEIGSYLGGSLQAVMRDPRCERVISMIQERARRRMHGEIRSTRTTAPKT